ncbi:hypothetical protein [Marinicrinis sediminis]|uniref:Uncharacterized protein n=1 Tax=Marinicrinis sediminis TaxID=1652465 RepID=A0ABW5RD29_9BACL
MRKELDKEKEWQQERNASQEELPPRSVKHPSQKGKRVRLFYLLLLLIFVLLTFSLMLWGQHLST